MSRVREAATGSSDVNSVHTRFRGPIDSGKHKELDPLNEQLRDIRYAINGNIEFGDPQDPSSPESATRAGVTAGGHPGTLVNILGSWVEVPVTAVGRSTVTCYHNLFQDEADYVVPVTGEPNVRWLNFGWMHDGTANDATTELMLTVWFGGGAVAANSIALEVSVDNHAIALPTIGGANPILLSLFFIPATRGE